MTVSEAHWEHIGSTLVPGEPNPLGWDKLSSFIFELWSLIVVYLKIKSWQCKLIHHVLLSIIFNQIAWHKNNWTKKVVNWLNLVEFHLRRLLFTYSLDRFHWHKNIKIHSFKNKKFIYTIVLIINTHIY